MAKDVGYRIGWDAISSIHAGNAVWDAYPQNVRILHVMGKLDETTIFLDDKEDTRHVSKLGVHVPIMFYPGDNE